MSKTQFKQFINQEYDFVDDFENIFEQKFEKIYEENKQLSFPLLKQKIIEEINMLLEKYLRTLEINKRIKLFSNYINKFKNISEEKIVINFDNFLKSINYEYDIDDILVLLDSNEILFNALKKISQMPKYRNICPKLIEIYEIKCDDVEEFIDDVDEVYDSNFYSEDSVKMYLKDIQKYSLLTPEEENLYAKQKKRW